MSDLIAIIPARGGSKRIPKKNIRNFLGRPIIEYSISAALDSSLFSRVIVSTDSEDIKNVAINAGAEVPWLRSKANSDDYATTGDVLFEVLDKLKRNYQFICCIYPTAPFLNSDFLKLAFKEFTLNKADSLFPIMEYSYPIQRSLKFNEKNIVMNWPENYNLRSQDIERTFHDAGQFYYINVESFKKFGKLYMPNSIGLIIPSNLSQDIDSENDWLMAEFKFKYLKNLSHM